MFSDYDRAVCMYVSLGSMRKKHVRGFSCLFSEWAVIRLGRAGELG